MSLFLSHPHVPHSASKRRNPVHTLIEMQSRGSHVINIAGTVPYSVNRRGDKIKEAFVVLNLAYRSSEHHNCLESQKNPFPEPPVLY